MDLNFSLKRNSFDFDDDDVDDDDDDGYGNFEWDASDRTTRCIVSIIRKVVTKW